MSAAVSPLSTFKTHGITFGVTYFGPAAKPVPVQPAEPQPRTPSPVEKPTKIILNGVNFDFDMETLQPQSH
ncbi:MAG: hypothetical protein P4L50_25180 [Anaerolineaceae bacterium]|nr:hypothetical protein [Anaerolineaceae bacterium]